VNIDFEEYLFNGKRDPVLNQRLEFIAFWLDQYPVLTTHSYSLEYFDYIFSLTGRYPQVVKQGDAIFWWGELRDARVLKEIAQKSFCFNYFKDKWSLEGSIIYHANELRDSFFDGHHLLKTEGKMSGRGHYLLSPSTKKEVMNLEFYQAIVEPLYQRIDDVTALYLPDEERFIYYLNFVDQRFQWKGSLYSSHVSWCEISENWLQDLNNLKSLLEKMGFKGIFCVDAFYYEKDDNRYFYPGSEINPRKTMGWVNYQFHKRWGKECSKLGMVKKKLSFEQWRELTKEGFILLSPPGSYFTLYWLSDINLSSLVNAENIILQKILRS
jgi:hypothetical protein